MGADTFNVVNLYADENGESHFRDLTIELKEHPFGGSLSAPFGVTQLWIRKTPEGQDSDFHNAPRRQLIVALGGGTSEITASDGEKRLIKSGELLLVEDTFGKGHRSKAFDGIPRFRLFIALPEGMTPANS